MGKKKQVQPYNDFVNVLVSGFEPYDFNDKSRLVTDIVNSTLNRTQMLFKYDNLFETTTRRLFERFLQIFGYVVVAEVEGKLYVLPGKLSGGLGGELDHNYEPTLFIASNPYLKFFKNLKVGVDCVVIRNDSSMMGLLPILRKYATLIGENEITMRITEINERAMSLLSASDDTSLAGAEKFLSDIEAGKLGVAAEAQFFDGIKVQPMSNGGTSLQSLIELEQYLKASLLQEIGINSNYNMKREAINIGEAALNDDALLPLVQDMLECRKVGFEEVERVFGHKVTVEFDSAWEIKEAEMELELEVIENTDPAEVSMDEEGSIETEKEDEEPEKEAKDEEKETD